MSPRQGQSASGHTDQSMEDPSQDRSTSISKWEDVKHQPSPHYYIQNIILTTLAVDDNKLVFELVI